MAARPALPLAASSCAVLVSLCCHVSFLFLLAPGALCSSWCLSLLPWAPALAAVHWECAKDACLSLVGRARSVFWLGAVPTTANFLYSFSRLFSCCCLVWSVLMCRVAVAHSSPAPGPTAWQRQHRAVCHVQSTFFYLLCTSCPLAQWAGLSWYSGCSNH